MFDPLAPMRHINLLSVLLMRLIGAQWPRAMRGAPPAPVRWCLARYQAALVAAIHVRCAQAGCAAPDMTDADLIKWFVAGPFGRGAGAPRAVIMPKSTALGIGGPLSASPHLFADEAAPGLSPAPHGGCAAAKARAPPDVAGLAIFPSPQTIINAARLHRPAPSGDARIAAPNGVALKARAAALALPSAPGQCRASQPGGAHGSAEHVYLGAGDGRGGVEAARRAGAG